MGEGRGKSLERAFAEWMKKELGYTRTKLRIPVKGKIADRSYEVDVFAEKFSRMWDWAWRIGLFLLALSVITYLMPREMSSVKKGMENAIAFFNPAWARYALWIFGIGAIVFGWKGRQNFIKYAWVECKDTQANIKRAQVQKLAASVDDVRKDDQAKWKPDEVFLVSGSDFDHDAINFAREHGFICYQRSGEGFKRVL